MQQITVDVPDEIAERLVSHPGELQQILALGLREVSANPADGVSRLSDVLEFLASLPSPQETLELRLSPSVQAEIDSLLEKSQSVGVNAVETCLWEHYEYVGHLVQKAKTQAAQKVNDDYNAKNRIFYGAMVNAWLSTKLERDKQLLGLSVTAIGLLVTLLRTVGISDFWEIGVFGIALISFFITVISIVCIFNENATHVEKVLDGAEATSKELIIFDKFAEISFILGMSLIFLIGIMSVSSELINLKK